MSSHKGATRVKKPYSALTFGSIMQCYGRNLRRVPVRVLDEPMLRMHGFEMKRKPAHARIIEKATAEFEKDPGGSRAWLHLMDIAGAMAAMEKYEGELVFNAFRKVMDAVVEWECGDYATIMVADWLLDIYASSRGDRKAELATDMRTLLHASSGGFRKELLFTLTHADHEYFSPDCREMRIFDIVELSRAELEELHKNAANDYVRCTAGVLFDYQNDEEAERERLEGMGGPFSASDLLDTTHGSMAECLRIISELDPAELIEEMAKKKAAKDSWKEKCEAFRRHSHEAGQESEDAAKLLDEIAREAMENKGTDGKAREAVGLMAEAMGAAQVPLKRMIALVSARLRLNVPDRNLHADLALMLEPLILENAECIKGVLGEPGDEMEKRMLLGILAQRMGGREITGVREQWGKRDVSRLVAAFQAGPREPHAAKYLERAVEIATSGEATEALAYHSIGELLEMEAKIPEESKNAATRAAAQCLVNAAAGMDGRWKENSASYIRRWLPALAPETREKMLMILDSVADCSEGSAGEKDLLAFELLKLSDDELESLGKRAASVYVRRMASEKLEERAAGMAAETGAVAPGGAHETWAESGEISDAGAAAGSESATKLERLLRDFNELAKAEGMKPAEEFDRQSPTGHQTQLGMKPQTHEDVLKAAGNARTRPREGGNRSKLELAAMRFERVYLELNAGSGMRTSGPGPEKRQAWDTGSGAVVEAAFAQAESVAAGDAPGARAARYMEDIAAASSQITRDDVPRLYDAIGRVLDRVRVPDGVHVEDAVSERAARCLVVIVESVPECVKDEVAAHIRFRLPDSPAVKMKMMEMMKEAESTETIGRGVLIFSLVQPLGKDLEVLAENAADGEVRRMAAERIAELADVEAFNGMTKVEKAVMGCVFRTATGSRLPEGVALVREMKKMDPGLRRISEMRVVEDALCGKDASGKGWKERVLEAEAACGGMKARLALSDATDDGKKAAAIAHPELLTNWQMRLVPLLAGRRWNENDETSASEKIANAAEGAKKYNASLLRALPYQTNACARMARVLAMQRSGEDPMRVVRSSDVETLAKVTVGKVATGRELLIFAEGLQGKNPLCFDMLDEPGHGMDFGIEKFRQMAFVARQVYDLLDILGAVRRVSASENREGSWNMGKSSGNMEDCGFSYTLMQRDGNPSTISALFDGMSGQARPEEASAIAKEVFELGIISGMLETPGDAAVLAELADLAIASENHKDLRAGKLADMMDGRGSTVALTIEHGGKVYGMHAGDTRWMVVRKGVRVAGSKDHTLMHDELIRAIRAIEREDYETANSIIAENAGRRSIVDIQNRITRRSPTPAEIYEEIIWHHEPGEGSLGKRTSALGLSFSKLGMESFDLQDGDAVVLCTDGISNVVCEHMMAAALVGNGAATAAAEMGKMSDERRGDADQRGAAEPCGCRVRVSDEDRFVMVHVHAEKKSEAREGAENTH